MALNDTHKRVSWRGSKIFPEGESSMDLEEFITHVRALTRGMANPRIAKSSSYYYDESISLIAQQPLTEAELAVRAQRAAAKEEKQRKAQEAKRRRQEASFRKLAKELGIEVSV